MAEKKKFEITQEILDIFEEADAIENMRDRIIVGPTFWWFDRRAIKYTKQFLALYKKAWKMIEELHPSSAGLVLTWTGDKFVVEQ